MNKQIFAASISNLDSIMTYYRQILTNSGIRPDEGKKFELALEEATVNIIYYAYHNSNGVIEIEYRLKNHPPELEISLKDSGRPFNPCNSKKLKKPTNSELQNIGGLGIHFMKELVDKIEYSFADNMNVLSLTKCINP